MDFNPQWIAIMASRWSMPSFRDLSEKEKARMIRDHHLLSSSPTGEVFGSAFEELVESGEIEIWKTGEVIFPVRAEIGLPRVVDDGAEMAAGHGKIILFGEHAVVYGSHAIAAPIPLAVRARVVGENDGVWLAYPRWGVEQRLQRDSTRQTSFEAPAALLLGELGLFGRSMRIEVFSEIPRAMGLGGSAAVAVAIIRALDRHFELGLSDDAVNGLAFQCECIAHGTPSGIDNTVATFGQPLVYKKGASPSFQPLHLTQPIAMIVGMTGVEGSTAEMVARVREGRRRNRTFYDSVIQEIDSITVQALEALDSNDLVLLGDLMNTNHGFLRRIGVSSRELEELIRIALSHGACGAKLTGGGGGGSMIALFPDGGNGVVEAMQNAGYRAMEVQIG
jgi:hydroxymethylglutaryl-CoA reductase